MYYITEQHEYCVLDTCSTCTVNAVVDLCNFSPPYSEQLSARDTYLALLLLLMDKVFVLMVNFNICSTVMFRVQGLHFWIGLKRVWV